jgi:hypothetical protein
MKGLNSVPPKGSQWASLQAENGSNNKTNLGNNVRELPINARQKTFNRRVTSFRSTDCGHKIIFSLITGDDLAPRISIGHKKRQLVHEMQRPGGLRPRPFSSTTMLWLVGASLSLLINNTLLVVSEAFVPTSNMCLHGDSSTSLLCNALAKTSLPKILATRQVEPSASSPRRRRRQNVEQWKMAAANADDDTSTIDATLSIRGGANGGRMGGGVKQQEQKQQRRQLVREMVAELIGTFLLVQIGTGSVMSAVFTDSLVGLFQIASVWIIAVTIAISTTAGISGAHLNPAMSVAFASLRPSKSFGWNKVIPYSLAQVTGAVLASWVNLLLYASTIRAFEASHGIIRASATGIASAKVFGEYFRYAAIVFIVILVATRFGGRDIRDRCSRD